MRAFLLALVLAVGVAATAWAAMPDGNGAISGCYAKKGGKLRVVNAGKKCKKSERPLTLSQTGPAGATGAKGAAGPKGPKGDAGTPSVAYAAEGFDIIDIDGVELAALDLPAGKYVLLATGVASASGPDGALVSCFIGSSERDFFGEVDQTVPEDASTTFTGQRSIELATAATVSSFCNDAVGSDTALGLTMTALPVGNIVHQP
jgi:hypothetical protein